MKKIINKYITASIVSACMALGINTSVNAGEYGFQKIAYHVTKRQAGALRNIQNHINAVGKDNMDLRVIMHGKGLSMLLLPEEAGNTKLPTGNANDALSAKIAGLKAQGVSFKVCANTLKGKKITLDQLYDAEKSDIVASGVAELAHLQARGFTYLRP